MRSIAGSVVVLSGAILLGATIISDGLDGYTVSPPAIIAYLLGLALVSIGLIYLTADRGG